MTSYRIELHEKSFLGFTYDKQVHLVPTNDKEFNIITPKGWITKIVKK